MAHDDLSTRTPTCFPDLTERELFSIYMKYPEINFDGDTRVDDASKAESNHAKMAKTTIEAHDSSPSSHREDLDTDESRLTCSTAHTTPLKHLMFKDERPQDNAYANFVRTLQSSTLPDATKSYFHSLASQIVQIGNHLFDNTIDRRGQDFGSKLEKQIADLVRLIQFSAQGCSDQTSIITWLTDLTAFAITPTDIALWSVYRQRSALITKHLDLPSVTEFRLIETLLHLHHAYIYQEYIHASQCSQHRSDPFPQINHLTLTIQTFLTAYKTWLHAMSALRGEYIAPLLRRIQESPWVRREIEQSELSIEMAKTSLHKRYTSGEIAKVLHEDQVRGAEMLAQRRSRSSVLPDSDTTSRGDGAKSMAERLAKNGKRASGLGSLTRVRREHTM